MATDEDFELLLALADEADGEDVQKAGICSGHISASDGENEANDGDDSDLLNSLAQEADMATESHLARQVTKPAAGFQPMCAPSQAAQAVKNPAKQETFAADGVEKYSGLQVVKTKIPLGVLRDRLSNLVYLKVAQIRSKPMEGAWATVGVLSAKSTPRQSQSGKMFGIWTISDLDGAEITLFLFGDAYQSASREMESSVIAIYDAKTRFEDQKDGQSKLSMSVYEGHQVERIGLSRDFAYCKGVKKNGQKCRAAVNKAKCEYCPYHLTAAMKKLGSGRAQLRANTLKTSLRNATKPQKEASSLAQGASTSRPVQRRTKEEIDDVIHSQVSSSVGARYLKQLTAKNEKQQFVDPEVPVGMGLFNPQNRPGSKQAPPAQHDGDDVKRDGKRAKGNVSLTGLAKLLGRDRSFISASGNAPPEKGDRLLAASTPVGKNEDSEANAMDSDRPLKRQKLEDREAHASEMQKAAQRRAEIRAKHRMREQATNAAPQNAEAKVKLSRTLITPPKVGAGSPDGILSGAKAPERLHSSTSGLEQAEAKAEEEYDEDLLELDCELDIEPDLQQSGHQLPSKDSAGGSSCRTDLDRKIAQRSVIQNGREETDASAQQHNRDSEQSRPASTGRLEPPKQVKNSLRPIAKQSQNESKTSAVGRTSRAGLSGSKVSQTASVPAAKQLPASQMVAAARRSKQKPLPKSGGDPRQSKPPIPTPNHRATGGQAEPSERSHLRRKSKTAAYAHLACEYDPETGSMVEVQDPENDWLNGRAIMPHQQARNGLNWSQSPAQAIAQKQSSLAAKATQAEQQHQADAQKRLKAASILRSKSSQNSDTTSNDENASPHEIGLQTASHQLGSVRPPTKKALQAEKEGVKGVSTFYSSAASSQAKRADRQYGQRLKGAANHANKKAAGFAATFGSILEESNGQQITGSRYQSLVDDEEQERIEKMLNTLQACDEVAQRAESVTKLNVSAYQCHTCNKLTEHKPPGCQNHHIQRVQTTKRWWVCNGCGDHSSSLGERHRRTRCKKCPSTDFTAAPMRKAAKQRAAGASSSHAYKESLVSTVEEAHRHSSFV